MAGKTLTTRVKDLEMVIGRLLTKLDKFELDKDISKVDIFGDPKRAGLSWSVKEKLSFIHAFLVFIEARAKYHQRTVDALMAYLEHNGLLREENLRKKHDKLSEIVKTDEM